MLCSSKDQLVVKFQALLAEQHFGERVELSAARVQAVGCFRFHANLVALRVLLMLLNLLSCPRARGGGGVSLFSARFASLQVAVAFCLRLDVQVTSSVRGKSRDLVFLVLAFSTALTLKSSGFRHDECRPEASAWACCLLACSTPAWSNRAFRAVHRFCWGHALLSAQDSAQS